MPSLLDAFSQFDQIISAGNSNNAVSVVNEYPRYLGCWPASEQRNDLPDTGSIRSPFASTQVASGHRRLAIRIARRAMSIPQ
jgi:hypothetical protein